VVGGGGAGVVVVGGGCGVVVGDGGGGLVGGGGGGTPLGMATARLTRARTVTNESCIIAVVTEVETWFVGC